MNLNDTSGINPKLKCLCYYNLHKHCFSVKQNSRVVTHLDIVPLVNVTYRVSKKGRERVLKQKRKNVHAFVSGYLFPDAERYPENKEFFEKFQNVFVKYNPYKHEHFCFEKTNLPCVSSSVALLVNKQIII